MALSSGSTGGQVTALPVARPGVWDRLRSRESLTGIAFVAPFLIGFILFSALPMLASLALSFTRSCSSRCG